MNLLLHEWSRISRSALARNAAWMVAGQGTGFVLQAIYFVVLARLLGAVQYGIFAGAFAFTVIVATYSSLGTGTIFIRYVSSVPKRFALFWGNILVVTLSVGILLVLILHFLGSHVLNPASASLVLLAATANCICMQLAGAAGCVFQAFEQLRITALLNLLTNLIRTVTALGMILVLHHATAWQWAVASTVVSALAAGIAVTAVTIRFGWPKFRSRIFTKYGMEGFGYSFALSTSFLYNDLDKAMLSHYGMNLANGIYTMAYRVVDIATTPLTSIQAAALPQFFRRGESSLKEAAKLSHKLLKRGFLLGLAASSGMFIAAPLIPKMAGAGFQDSVLALRWLCLIPTLRSIHLLTGCALTGAGLQKYRTMTQTCAVCFNLGLNLWLIPSHGWRGAAWSSVATDASLAAMNWAVLRILILRGNNMALLQESLRRIPRIPSKLYRETRDCIAPVVPVTRLWWRHCTETRPVAVPGGPVVSLTSYGKRIRTAYLAIESIARGDLRPSRLILWLDDRSAFNNPPATIRRLMQRGLEVRLCDNYGPHSKYYPYLQSLETFECPLVTADDDILYPAYWLKRLFNAFQAEPGVIHCHNAHVHTVTDKGIALYAEGSPCWSTEASFRNLALGFSGVIYPPLFLDILKKADKGFERCCLTADDVWLHVQALRAGYKVRQVGSKPVYFPPIPGTQTEAVSKKNLRGGNDRQMQAIYSGKDIWTMLERHNAEEGIG